jgi:hypothetical protein
VQFQPAEGMLKPDRNSLEPFQPSSAKYALEYTLCKGPPTQADLLSLSHVLHRVPLWDMCPMRHGLPS